MDLQNKLQDLTNHLEQGLVERQTAVRLALLAALSGEHLLLIGPPGTAKSEIARRLHKVFRRTSYFERLLTRFSVPEELFGPYSLEALEDSRYERSVEGYLPTAAVAFVDEIFKANSAVLNSLLTIINERQFDNGATRMNVPLICLIGASNELPEGTELDALYDRFLLRYHVGPVTSDGFSTLIDIDDTSMGEISPSIKLTDKELEAVQAGAAVVGLPESVRNLLSGLREYLHNNNIYVSDRRWLKVIKLLKTAAFANGRDEVSVFDGWLLQHALWNEPEDRELIEDWYCERIGTGSASAPGSVSRIVTVLETKFNDDRESKSHKRNKDGQPLYYGENGGEIVDKEPYLKHNEDDEPLYLAPPQSDKREERKGLTKSELTSEFQAGYGHQIRVTNQNMKVDAYTKRRKNQLWIEPDPVLISTPYSEGHIDSRVRRTRQCLEDVTEHLSGLKRQLESVETQIAEDLWLPLSFVETASSRLREKVEKSEQFVQRLQVVEEGFQNLPREKRVEIDHSAHDEKSAEREPNEDVVIAGGTGE